MPTTGSPSQNSNLKFKIKLLRRAYRRSQQSMRYGRQAIERTPILFANSFPKSGTHLLIQVLEGFSRIGPAVKSGLPAVVTFDGTSGRKRDSAEILGDLQRLKPGDIAYGHLHAEAELIDVLCSACFASYLILRDPRDVVVSHVHYITEMAPGHIHHRFYKDELTNFDARLKFSITGNQGIENKTGTTPLPDIGSRLAPFLDWLEKKEVLTMQYERLIAQKKETITKILEHALRQGFESAVPQEKALQILESNINPERSPTFRSGKSGAWRDTFNDENKRLFKEVTGDMLIRLGYEKDTNW